ncbi:L-piperidine-6-carboxylate dehydrogenase [Membranihabitans marinus]|uniref:L-piperidine-6-carboxylate dehydrogenase n=1 Tax=Membranihabitans marinus TaxID=1227546 RepID=UPI001F1A7BA9|nr:aldehyde dehydrogenase family protein [Membranihabitans marinus]
MKTVNPLHRFSLRSPYASVSTGRKGWRGEGDSRAIVSPVDGGKLGEVKVATSIDLNKVIQSARIASKIWMDKPAPERGDIVRQIGNAFRNHKEDLGYLISYEMGKSLQESWGEVQEVIDICDFAVGLSRQLYGLTMHSERADHRMYEQWHPLGLVGIISAFNFPVAVWAWNAMISLVCGNVCIWKPSEKTPFSALACQHIIQEVLEDNDLPEGLINLIIGDRRIGAALASNPAIDLISATGSTVMGKQVAQSVAARLGKSLLELGGNNAIIITPDADLQLAIPAIVFGAVGTSGQRCTSTRRLIIHKDIYPTVVEKLITAYHQIKIGSPLDINNHMGPLIDVHAVEKYKSAIHQAQLQKGKVLTGNEVLSGHEYHSGCYVRPTLIQIPSHAPIVQEETFAPILYLLTYHSLEEAIEIQNEVKQGLSSAIFTLNMREAETFLSHRGSDCGIANVNIGTSGAEIGGAFGGEKETGGGRESGSDSWKAYMRRQTCTSNWSKKLPLAQGIKFNL